MSPELTAWVFAHGGTAVLAFARALGLAWAAPGFATPGIDARNRVLLAMMLGVVMLPAVESATGGATGLVLGWQGVAPLCLGEVLIGAALGWSAGLIVAGARQAGELVGMQGGFAPAALLDPEASDEMTAVGHLYGLVALGVFLSLDGPLALVQSLIESYRVIPPGGGALTEATAELAFARVGMALELALRGAAPVALALTLTGVALGLLGKAAPSLPLMSLTMPVRALTGLLLILLGLATLAATFGAAWGGWLEGSPFRGW